MYLRMLLVLLFTLAGNVQAGENPSLVFSHSDRRVAVLELNKLLSEVPQHEIEFDDPFHQKTKRFRALAMSDVLDAGFGKDWRDQDFSDAVFIALDGYRAVSSHDKLLEEGGYIAFADLDAEPGWELIGDRDSDPAPFYLLWTGEGQTAAKGYPWPWQLAEISLVSFQDKYPKVYPADAAAGSSVMRGFEIFKMRCLRCHAMDQQGGKVGPDLNAPMSITEYRSPMMIREFIRKPSRFRYTHMPDHEDLSDTDLDDLLDYLRHQAQRLK